VRALGMVGGSIMMVEVLLVGCSVEIKREQEIAFGHPHHHTICALVCVDRRQAVQRTYTLSCPKDVHSASLHARVHLQIYTSLTSAPLSLLLMLYSMILQTTSRLRSSYHTSCCCQIRISISPKPFVRLPSLWQLSVAADEIQLSPHHLIPFTTCRLLLHLTPNAACTPDHHLSAPWLREHDLFPAHGPLRPLADPRAAVSALYPAWRDYIPSPCHSDYSCFKRIRAR
jgi:hypothetical protein